MISNRAKILLNDPPPIVKYHIIASQDLYCKESNPRGYLNFGTAENHLLQEIHEGKFRKLPTLPKSLHHYNHPAGFFELKENYVKFLAHYFNIQNQDPNNTVIGPGVSSLLEMLSFALFDEGEKVLTLSPLYNGFFHDFQTRNNVEVLTCNAFDDDYKLNLQIIEDTLKVDQKIKAILLCNPHNPLGVVHTKSEVEGIIQLAKKYQVELITDEIYGNTSFDEEFVSAYGQGLNQHGYEEHIHHLYGLAKDFGLSGLKIGFFATKNEKLSKVMNESVYFYTVSTMAQHLTNFIISDLNFCDELFKENKIKIKNLTQKLEAGFKKLNIPVILPKSGIFCTIDLSNTVKTSEEETKLFEKIFNELKISLGPGQNFRYPKYGMYRMCFAQEDFIINEFFKRLSKLEF